MEETGTQNYSVPLKIYWAIRTAFLMIVSFGVIIIPPSIILLPFPFSVKVKYLHPCWRVFFTFVITRICKAKIVVEDLRSPDEIKDRWQGLYMANHQSLVDVPLFMTIATVPALMKKELLRVPFFGLAAYEAGCIPVDRKNPAARKRAFEKSCLRLSEGYPLQCYPEGTRSKTGKPKPFSEIHPALLYYAFEHNLPITPVVMKGTQHFFGPKGEVIPGHTVKVRVYPRLNPKDFTDHRVFAETAWNKVIEGFAEL